MSLFSSLDVSASGMAAQRTRAELLVENMANAETTRTPEGGPYRRQDVVFESDSSVGSGSFSSKVAVSARTGKAAAKSSTTCVRPTHSRSFSSDIGASPRFRLRLCHCLGGVERPGSGRYDGKASAQVLRWRLKEKPNRQHH